jgi:hypothetical protein
LISTKDHGIALNDDEWFEPGCELLLHRVGLTAGKNYQPASRVRAPKAV